ncbi:MAG: DNA integrity scanning protein DisA nucleotide-binding domain protein [Actinobacteria bacterium]|nr:DNA integrity scanning protein DisA nucleotide-binding domain protein [Actinomycetota bacterium]
MRTIRPSNPARLARIVGELAESGFSIEGSDEHRSAVLDELDYALRPPVHERRVPTVGAIIGPRTPASDWNERAQLDITHRPLVLSLDAAHRFADGLSSWIIRSVSDAPDELAVFDRPAGSERDLVVLAEAFGATLVQRHPSGGVRLVGDFGVLRWDGLSWHHEPPISTWIDSLLICGEHGDRDVIETMLEFAVHDLGARGIGATLVYRPDDDPAPSYEVRLPAPPPLRVVTPSNLAPLRHVLSQIDGAAVFDRSGTLLELGVRLAPSVLAETNVESFRGMRHTSGRRYSYDDRRATVIVVSEDGPVTVLRKGEVLGASRTEADSVRDVDAVTDV